MKYLLPILLLGILLTNCGDDSQFLTFDQQNAIDKKIIEDYLKENGLTAEEGEFGIHYIIEEEGTGTKFPTVNSTVIINYTGYFPNGEVFEEREAAQTVLSRTIQGWQFGIPLFKKDGKGKLLIPSRLAYGVQGSGGIPRDQVIIFDIELLNFL